MTEQQRGRNRHFAPGKLYDSPARHKKDFTSLRKDKTFPWHQNNRHRMP